jgi:tryptophan 2,3-dioxygenase
MADRPASMSYGDYLGLDQLLAAQQPLSSNGDEMLFIIIHQTKELWLKQVVRELRLSTEMIQADQLIPVHKSLSRVSRIQAVMTLSWDVLATMTPSDYPPSATCSAPARASSRASSGWSNICWA